MTLRLKLVLALTLLAAAATAAIGVASYVSTERELQATIDDSLDTAVQRLFEHPEGLIPGFGGEGRGPRDPGWERPRSFEQVLVQVIDADGTVLFAPESGQLPVDEADLQIAASPTSSDTTRHDVNLDGEPYRMVTVSYGDGAVQLARSLSEIDDSLAAILRSTLVAVAVVAAASVLLGWLLAAGITRRIERLTAAASLVADTGRLDVPVPADGRDEAGRLGRAFAGMLAALHASREEQHRLVQDAGHELRTPLTSLRTNIEVLQRRFAQLDTAAREQLLADLGSETRELTDLVNELVELATDERDDEPRRQVRLADVVERAAARARRRTGRTIVVRADDGALVGQPGALERAAQNLIDNACKFAADGDVEVTVAAGRVEVRDHGPGLEAQDLPHLFERFYRSVAMRSRPGSGLGLAIVAAVAERHGGEVFAANAADGGAVVGFVVPIEP